MQQTKPGLTACLTQPHLHYAQLELSHPSSAYIVMPIGIQPPGGTRKIMWKVDITSNIFKTLLGL